jgi:ATP-dependent DNA helicase RecG
MLYSILIPRNHNIFVRNVGFKDYKISSIGRIGDMSDFSWILHQHEGQFFERKSCYDRSKAKAELRPVREVARDIAETISAMANADGGTLVLGIEDDGLVSGANYPDDRLKVLHHAPKTHIRPPLRTRIQEGKLEGKRILVFETDWSMEAHQLTDGRYLLRVDDKNIPFAAAEIEAMKEGKRRRATETRFIDDATLADLDLNLAWISTDRYFDKAETERIVLGDLESPDF